MLRSTQWLNFHENRTNNIFPIHLLLHGDQTRHFYQREGSIKEIIIIKLYAIIVRNIVRYCIQLYAISLIMIESHSILT